MLDRKESGVKLSLGKVGREEDFKKKLFFISHDLILELTSNELTESF